MAGRLTIIGGGVMGLMTAYQAAPLAESVTVLDRSRAGDPDTASFGLTRSVRNDYRDPDYARLAFEARRLWREFERECGRGVLVDGGWLDVDAGFADLAAVTQTLGEGLAARGVRVAENTEPLAITQADGTWVVSTSDGPVESDALVVTAGLGTNDVLGLVPGCTVRFPLRADRPTQFQVLHPPARYDLVADDEFILGAVPGADGLYTGVGWRGTGYKFAPWVGRVLAQLALQQGTVYDIGRFAPARFAASEAREGVAL